MSQLAHGFEDLGEHVRRAQDLRLDGDLSLGAVRACFLTSGRRAPSKLARVLQRGLLLAAAVGAVGVVVALGGTRLLRPAPLGVTAGVDHHVVGVGDWIRVRNAAQSLDFSDGTSITLDPGSRGRLEAVDAAGARLTIESGHADVKVVPGRNGRWHLNLGPFGVDVTGTEFDIGWNPDAEELSLVMREGKVMVSGCVLGDGRPLLAGEHLTASCRDRRFEVVRPKSQVEDSSPPAREPLPEPITQASPAVASRSDGAPPAQLGASSWQALARAGKYKPALSALDAAGVELELARASAEDLSLLGDVTRFGGRVEASLEAYRTLRRRFHHTPLAANAAFAIGRIQFDQRGAFADAERSFARYLAEAPRGALAREALGRRMEALDRTGNHDAARSVAASYQKSYPRGPHIRLAERLLLTR